MNIPQLCTINRNQIESNRFALSSPALKSDRYVLKNWNGRWLNGNVNIKCCTSRTGRTDRGIPSRPMELSRVLVKWSTVTGTGTQTSPNPR